MSENEVFICDEIREVTRKALWDYMSKTSGHAGFKVNIDGRTITVNPDYMPNFDIQMTVTAKKEP